MLPPSPCPADDGLLFLLRHGATASNLAQPPRLQGCGIDRELASTGRSQAEATAKFFSSRRISAVYSSTLLRARETAEAIARPHQLAVSTVAELVEVNVGRWENLNWPEIAAQDPEAHRLFRADPVLHGYPGGETLQQLFERAMPALRAIASANPGGRIVVVAHGAVNRVVLASLLGLPFAHAEKIPQDNCGINVLRYFGETLKVLTVNATLHLEEG